MIEALQAMGSVVLDPYLVVLILMTTILGVVIGVLPGLGATTGAALLLPFTLTMRRSEAQQRQPDAFLGIAIPQRLRTIEKFCVARTEDGP